MKESYVVDYFTACDGLAAALKWSADYIAPQYIRVRFQQIGLCFTAMYGNIGTDVTPDQSIFASIDGDPSKMRDGIIQIGLYDFDHDGIDELVIGFKVGIMDPQLWVYRYFPPSSVANAGRKENWQSHGPFAGQDQVYLEGPSIVLPYGSQYLYEEFTWVKDRFILTSPEPQFTEFDN